MKVLSALAIAGTLLTVSSIFLSGCSKNPESGSAAPQISAQTEGPSVPNASQSAGKPRPGKNGIPPQRGDEDPEPGSGPTDNSTSSEPAAGADQSTSTDADSDTNTDAGARTGMWNLLGIVALCCGLITLAALRFPNQRDLLLQRLGLSNPPRSGTRNDPRAPSLSDHRPTARAEYRQAWEDVSPPRPSPRTEPGPYNRPAQEKATPIRVEPIVVGAPSPFVEPTPIANRYRPFPFRPDTVIDGWSTPQMAVRGASLRGHAHRYSGAPRQDDFAVHLLADGRIIVAVADGVSQASCSHIGATTAVRYAVQWLKTQVPEDPAAVEWRPLAQGAAWALAEQTQLVLGLEEPDPAHAEKELACTLVCALVEPRGESEFRAYVAGVGDSSAWILRAGLFEEVLGGKTVGPDGFSSSAVSGLPRVPEHFQPTTVDFGVGDTLLLGTDGIGDPLGSGEGMVGDLFRGLLCAESPPSLLEFAHTLDFSRENFDDDRTLVALRPMMPDAPRAAPDSDSVRLT